MPKVDRFEELPIDSLVLERFQARKSNAGEGLEELAASIEKWGLLQPIVVCASEKNPGKWEIVCGQRRYSAHRQILKRDKIQAGIIETPISYEEGLALSASENVVRLDMTRKDLIDLCTDLHKKYGSFKDVAEETKLPYPMVRKYIRYDGLPEQLQAKVDSGDINVDLAMKVQDLATAKGEYKNDEAEELISVLKTVDNPIQTKILALKKIHPDADLTKIVETAEKPDQSLKLKITVGENLALPLKRYAADQKMDHTTAVLDFIENALSQNGYLGEQE